jgi:uncharacterized repeat protein (TIGR02543 family)
MVSPLIYAATWPALDAQEANVAAAIANASDGDTVTVPAGTATWSTQLTITKHITLQGAGVGQTIIYDNAPKGGSNQHLILVKLSGDNPPFRLTGFEFAIPANYTVIVQPYGVGILEFQGGGGTVVPGMSANVRIDHCKIKVAGVAMTFRNVLGLVDHVEYIDTGFANPITASTFGGWQPACIYMSKWGGKDWGHGSWADAPNWGTDKFLFFEDCRFTGARLNFPIDAYQGARYVARNCTFKDARVAGTGTEGSVRGAKEVECYNNTFISTDPFGSAQAWTSGTILVHDNLETNYRNGVQIAVSRQYQGPAWGHSTGRSPWDENDDFPRAYESGTCTAIGSLATARSYHTATLLANGNVLVAGGADGTNSLTSAELYDGINSTWTTTGNLSVARKAHTATALPDGTVLVVGGTDGTKPLASAERYDPASGIWSATGSLRTARYYHTATLLSNGTVLVTGGTDGTNPLASGELYDPAIGTWTATGNLETARYSDTATLLPNGTVLVAGGTDGTDSLASAELYDPATATWHATVNLGTARNLHTATLLSNGTVLVAGGTDGTNSLASAELYNPATGVWSATGGLAIGRYYHTATALANGTVLLAGGYDGANFLTSTQLYDPAAGSWADIAGLDIACGYHTLTSLLNGKALVTGGYDGSNVLASARAYDPATGKWGGGNDVTDITKAWLPDQWLGDGVSFIVINLSSPLDKNGEHAQSYLIGNTANTLKQGKAPTPFHIGDKYEIWKVKTSLDQPGQGSGILLTGQPPNASPVTWPQRGYPREPCYSWNNIDPTSGRQMDIVAQQPSIKSGRDYFNRTPKPGYTPFVYPHPLVNGVSSTPTPTPPPTPPPTVQVTVQTAPIGLAFTVDGTTYSATQTFSWASGSNHTVATASPQSGGTGIQYVWKTWSDNGTISHNVAPTTNKTYTANFTTQYYLTMGHGTGGTVSPVSGWKNSGATVSITATPTNNSSVSYSFNRWAGTGAGSYSGTNNPASIKVNGPTTENATFAQNPVQVVVQTNPAGRSFSVDGTIYTAAQSFSWSPGSSHTIATTSPQSGGADVQYVWTKWSDSGVISHTVAPATNKTYTATFNTQYYLTMSHGTGGTVSPASGWRNSGAAISITATPSIGYTFTGWTGTGTGSFSGKTNPVSIQMLGPISETASFSH